MVREFVDYIPLEVAQGILKQSARVVPRKEIVPLGQSYGRILAADTHSKIDVPSRDSSHMDGFAIRSSDAMYASPANPVKLRWVQGSSLGETPTRPLRKGEAHTVLTGGYLPAGADAVVQVERVKVEAGGVILTRPPERGEYVYPKGRDVKKGERVLEAGRAIRGTDQVLLGSLHIDKITAYAKPRVAIIPTGSELSYKIVGTEKGKVAESHSFLFSRLVEGAGGTPVRMPIAPDDADEITRSIRAALKVADLVLTIAGSSVSEKDLTETAINTAGRPGVLVHGMKVHRGRVMGFGSVEGKIVVILPGSIQGGVNAFTVIAYPVIRALLGRGFEPPPSVPARMANYWDAGGRYRDFSKIVYVKTFNEGESVTVEASTADTERMTFLTRSDGYLLLGESVVSLDKGDPVRLHLLPGLSGA